MWFLVVSAKLYCLLGSGDDLQSIHINCKSSIPCIILTAKVGEFLDSDWDLIWNLNSGLSIECLACLLCAGSRDLSKANKYHSNIFLHYHLFNTILDVTQLSIIQIILKYIPECSGVIINHENIYEIFGSRRFVTKPSGQFSGTSLKSSLCGTKTIIFIVTLLVLNLFRQNDQKSIFV